MWAGPGMPGCGDTKLPSQLIKVPLRMRLMESFEAYRTAGRVGTQKELYEHFLEVERLEELAYSRRGLLSELARIADIPSLPEKERFLAIYSLLSVNSSLFRGEPG